MAKQEKNAAELYREERKARLAKAAKKNAKGSKKISWGNRGRSAVSFVVVAAIILGIVAIILNSFGIFDRGKKMMTVGGTNTDKYEVVYYASQIYQNYLQYSSYYGPEYAEGFDWSVQPDKQAYSGEVEGVENPTFSDYFIYVAKERLHTIKAYVNYANANSITLDATELASVQNQIYQMKLTAENSQYGYSNFLRSDYGYGKGMTPALYEKILTEAALANKVQTIVNEDITAVYTDEKLEEIYNKNPKDYGVVSYRIYTVKAVAAEEGAAITEDDIAAAKAKAEALAALTSEEDFVEAVSDMEKALENEKYADYLTDDTLTLKEDATYTSLATVGEIEEDEAEADAENADEADAEEGKTAGTNLADWIFDAERSEGDTAVVKSGNNFTVFMVSEIVHKIPTEYTYDVRHILVKFPADEKKDDTAEGETAEGESSTDAETAPEEEKEPRVPELIDATKYENANIYIDVDLETTKDAQLYMEAQDILVEYLEGNMTAESFGELAKEYSEDGNASTGGLYENVAEGQMVAEFEGWALADGRKAGDVGIVETEFGYHIMYFVAKDEATTWSSAIKADKTAQDYSDFETELLEANPVADYKAKYETDIKDFLKILARNNINNLTAYGY